MQLSTFDFLTALKKNNNREWFSDNKVTYEKAKEQVSRLFDAINEELSKIDEIGKYRMYRIYRDVRFSKDKLPYKNHLSGIFMRKQPQNRGGFYVHLEPGNSFIGGGFWSPEKEDLLRIRESIALEDDLEGILNDPKLKIAFGALKGDAVKTAPKGFDKEHERIELIRHKQFILTQSFNDKEVFSEDFIPQIVAAYKILLPFFYYMTDVLTTDANGESIL